MFLQLKILSQCPDVYKPLLRDQLFNWEILSKYEFFKGADERKVKIY